MSKSRIKEIKEKKQRLKEAKKSFEKIPVEKIVSLLCNSLWEFIHSEKFENLLIKTSEISGYSREMLVYGYLGNLMPYTNQLDIKKRIKLEFSNVKVLDRWVKVKEGISIRAFSPSLTAQIFSGNIPGIEFQTLINSLLVKSPTLCKPSSRTPFFLNEYKKFLDEYFKEISPFVDVVNFSRFHQDEDKLKELVRDVPAVIVSGEHATIKKVKEYVSPMTKFLDYGNKVSVEIITEKELNPPEVDRIYDNIATDVVMFKQMGCMSAGCVFIPQKADINDFIKNLNAHILKKDNELKGNNFPDEIVIQQTHLLRTLLFEKNYKIYGDKFKIVLHKNKQTPEFFIPSLLHIIPYSHIQDVIEILYPIRFSIQAIALSYYIKSSARDMLTKEIPCSRVTYPGGLQKLGVIFPNEGHLGMKCLTRLVVWEKRV